MKVSKKILEKFNQPDTVLVISGYPEKKSNNDTTHGIAWYTRESLLRQVNEYGTRFVVLVEKGHDNRPRIEGNGNILVLRVFDKRKIRLFPQVLSWLIGFSQIKKTIVHSEFCVDGSSRNFLFLLPFLGLIKFFNKEIVFFAHNVVDTFDQIALHLNLRKNSLRLWMYNVGIKVYNKGLGLMVGKIVVLNTELKKRMQKFVSPEKVVYLPLVVNPVDKVVSRKMARRRLGLSDDRVILFFGFVSWYKGTDWLVKEFSRTNKSKKIKLIIAGGEAYSLKGKRYYQKYYQDIVKSVEDNKQIKITGFVPENKIGEYFKASDLVVLPYRGLIGASGCYKLAFKYKKPVMTSKALKSMIGVGSDKAREMIFRLSKDGMNRILTTVGNNKALKRLEKVTKTNTNESSLDGTEDLEYKTVYSVEKEEISRDLYRNSSGVVSLV